MKGDRLFLLPVILGLVSAGAILWPVIRDMRTSAPVPRPLYVCEKMTQDRTMTVRDAETGMGLLVIQAMPRGPRCVWA